MDFDTFGFEKVSEAVKESKSLTEVCQKLGISTGGTHTNALKQYILENNIDSSHFKIKSTTTKEKYNQNPKYCQCCRKIIPYEHRQNKFCNASCAASYNNVHIKKNYSNKLDEFSDEEFIHILKTSSNWEQISSKFGYKGLVNQQTRIQIRERAEKLAQQVNVSKNVDWSKVTKKELFETRSNWQSARTQIRKMAQDNYNNAGKEYKCAVCGYNKHVEIAHIKAVADFDDSTPITEINDINNLIGLCPNHHWEYDNGLLDISEYIKK